MKTGQSEQKLSPPETWLRGLIPGVSPLLQPVAHALLQAREEVDMLIGNLPEEKLWERPANAASPGFHLQHLSGVIDRLFTYARGESLSAEQLRNRESEGVPRGLEITIAELRHDFHLPVEAAIEQLSLTPSQVLTEERKVGRLGLPSTVLGLLVHAAEHAQRHVGQLLVTVKVLTEE